MVTWEETLRSQPVNHKDAAECGDQEPRWVGDGKEMNNSHVERLLHNYGIPATELMTVSGDVSRTCRCACSVHGWVEHRQRAARRLCVSPTPFESMLRPLGIQIHLWKMHERSQYLGTLHRYRRWVSKANSEHKASLRTTSQSLLDPHEDRDLPGKIRL
jgi:hypothetical protein